MPFVRRVFSAHPLFREYLVLALLVAGCLAGAFPGVLRGEMLSPAAMLYDRPPWAAYAPPGWSGNEGRPLYDIMNEDRPWYFLARQAMDAGEWPLWNPRWGLGCPLLGNGQTAVFYPFRVLHALIDIDVAMTLQILLRLAASGVAAYVCGRGLGLRIGVSRFLCVGWMLSTYVCTYCYWPLSDTSAWIPLMLLGVEYIAGKQFRRGFWTLLFSCTLSILSGHPETTFVTGFALSIYLLLRLVCAWQLRGVAAAVGIFSLAWLAATLVSAGQLLPFAEYFHNLRFPLLELQERLRRPLTPCAVPIFWIARFCGFSQDGSYWGDFSSIIFNPVYPGVAVSSAMLLLLCRNDKEKGGSLQRIRPLGLGISAGFLLLLAFDVPVVRSIGNLPIFRSVLLHHFAIFPIFVFAVMGALGLERWLSCPRKLRELAWCLISIPLAAIAACAVFLLYRAQIYDNGHESAILVHTIIAVGLFGSVLFVLSLHPLGFKPNTVANLAALLLAVDLLYANRGMHPSISRAMIRPDSALIQYLQSRPDAGRIGGTRDLGIPHGFLACYGLNCLEAHDAVIPARVLDFATLAAEGGPDPNALATYVLRNPDLPSERKFDGLEHVATLDGIDVYLNPNALPRVLLAGRVEAIENFERLAARFSKMSMDEMRKTVLVERPPAGSLPTVQGVPVGDARIVSEKSTRIEIEARATAPCALMLCDTYYPGWRAEIDGQPSEIFPADHVFRGVLLEPGAHRVVFEYKPMSFRIGMAVSVSSILLLIIAAARQWSNV